MKFTILVLAVLLAFVSSTNVESKKKELARSLESSIIEQYMNYIHSNRHLLQESGDDTTEDTETETEDGETDTETDTDTENETDTDTENDTDGDDDGDDLDDDLDAADDDGDDEDDDTDDTDVADDDDDEDDDDNETDAESDDDSDDDDLADDTDGDGADLEDAGSADGANAAGRSSDLDGAAAFTFETEQGTTNTIGLLFGIVAFIVIAVALGVWWHVRKNKGHKVVSFDEDADQEVDGLDAEAALNQTPIEQN